MTGPVPYLFFSAAAREALTFYRDVFGGDVALHTYADLGRADGPQEAIGHGELTGAVSLFGADVAADESAPSGGGIVLALLGTADPDTMSEWFRRLSAGATITDPLQERPWGDVVGRLTDRYGVPWLIGFAPGTAS